MLARFSAIALVMYACPVLAQESQPGWVRDPITGCRVWNPHPRENETIGWAGACLFGRAEGHGLLQWFVNGQPAERDEGEFRDGKANGWFVSTAADGSRYEGERRDSARHGRGTITFA